MKLRELFTEQTKSKSYDFDEIKNDETLLNFEFDKLNLVFENFGENGYNIYEYRDNFFIILETETEPELFAFISVYEQHGYNFIKDKGLLIVYGHESIELFFSDGELKRIHTR